MCVCVCVCVYVVGTDGGILDQYTSGSPARQTRRHRIDKHVLRAHHSPASAHTHGSRYTTQNTHPHMNYYGLDVQ